MARPGIKVLVCGGGRCNFTNAGTIEFLIEQFGRNGRFLTPALRAMDNEGLRDFFAGCGPHGGSPQFRESVSKLQFVSISDGSLVPYEGEYTWLAPGQGVLVKVTR